VELVVSHVPFFIVDGFDYHLGDLRPAKVQRTCAGGIEKTVHRQEGLAEGGRRGKVRFAGRLPCRRQVTNMGCPME
jgi:hypothetical protein